MNKTKISSTLTVVGSHALIFLILFYISGYMLAGDGFSGLDSLVLNVVTGIIAAIIISMANNYIQDALLEYFSLAHHGFLKFMIHIIPVSLVVFALDYLFFSFLDDSLSKINAEGLRTAGMSGENPYVDPNAIEGFASLPFMAQMFFSVMFFLIISSIVTIRQANRFIHKFEEQQLLQKELTSH